MSCGQEFSTEEIVMLIEKAARTSRPTRRSGKSKKKPSVEIKELAPSKAKESERASRRQSGFGTSATGHDMTKHDKPGRV